MARLTSPKAEELLDVKKAVLDRGYVVLVDYMGNDDRVAQAARTSYQQGTKTVSDNAGLISRLMEDVHTSPFEQVELVFGIRLPIFVMRQLVRHRMASLNEVSGRYSVLPDEFYVPPTSRMAAQSAANQQGSGELLDPEIAAQIIQALIQEQDDAYKNYTGYLESGLTRELARINIPVSLYTEIYWKIDLHNLLHFLRLRLDPHAQAEIRAYAEALYECVKAVAPLCAEAWEEFRLYAVTYSRTEQEFVKLAVEHTIKTVGKDAVLDGFVQEELDNVSISDIGPDEYKKAVARGEKRFTKFMRKVGLNAAAF